MMLHSTSPPRSFVRSGNSISTINFGAGAIYDATGDHQSTGR